MILEPIEASLFEAESRELQEALLYSGVVPVADPIFKLWNLPEGTRTVILIGGRGGMKTYAVSQFIAYQAAVNKRRCAILRDEKARLKETILSEILQRFDSIPFNTNVNRLENGLNDRETKNTLVFTMGFRASDKKKTANLKGLSNIDIAVIEEAEDIRDVSKFNNFADSLRKQGRLVIIILNTPDLGHWIIKRFFTAIPVGVPEGVPEQYKKEFEDFFDIIPKEIPGFVCIKTSFENNPYLPAETVHEYNQYGNPKSDSFDPHHYMTAIKGYSSSGRKGQILKKVKLITLAEYMALPYREHYGQDFGTASPAGCVAYKVHKNQSWCREINYLPMETLDIGKMYCRLNLNIADEITADNADEEAWRTLKNGFKRENLSDDDVKLYPQLLRGWNVSPCRKGKDSVNYGLDDMKSMELFAVAESENLWEEIRNYVYDQDKYGNYINDPIDEYNHLIDPWRYGLNRHRAHKQKPGVRAG